MTVVEIAQLNKIPVTLMGKPLLSFAKNSGYLFFLDK